MKFVPACSDSFDCQSDLRKAVKMPFGIGELPKEYNLKVHGPYDPAVYYGPSKLSLSGTHDLSMYLPGTRTSIVSGSVFNQGL